MKHQRDKGPEAACLILLGSEAQQVLDAFHRCLDVAVKESGVRSDPQTMSRCMDGKPCIRVNLGREEFSPHSFGKNFSSAAWKRVKARLAQSG